MTRKQDDAPLQAGYASRSTLHAPRFTLHAVALSLFLGLGSATAATPYQPIVERNVFGLKPPPPPPDPETLKPPVSKITLTGVMNLFGKKTAFLKTPPTPAGPAKPGQPPEPPKEHSYWLAQGQAEDGITVLEIDTVAKTVKVDNSGHIETLSFSTNAPTGGGANPGMLSPTGLGGGAAPPSPFPRTIPRPLRIPTPGSTATGSAVSPGLASGTDSASNPAGYGGTAYQTTDQVATVPQHSVEENVLLYEANRLKNEQLMQSGVRLPPMPPHPLAQGLNGDEGQGQGPAQSTGSPFRARPGMPMTQ